MAKEHKDASETEKVKLQGNLAEFRQALEDEIEAIKKNGQSSTVLSGGRRETGKANDHMYSFRVDYLPAMPPDTPCKLFLGKDSYEVTVVSYEADRITLAAKVKLPDTLASARLENGATILMEKLIQRIETNAEKNNAAGKRLLRTSDPHCTQGYSKISEDKDLRLVDNYRPSQERAIQSAISNDITYIWGPPGTGKSTVIAGIINELIVRDRSVLLLSHTNVAIDVAIKKADEKYHNLNPERSDEIPYPMLRLGNPSMHLDSRLELETHKRFLGKELSARIEELKSKRADYEACLEQLDSQIDKARWVKENQLLPLALLLESMDILENELDLLQDNRDLTQSELDNAQLASDPNQDFRALEEQYLRTEQELLSLSDQIDQAKSHLAFLPYKVQLAQDELVKHRKLKALRDQEADQLSLPAQQEQIERMKMQITDLIEKDKQLVAEHTLHTKNIEAYSLKGTLGRLFAGKAAYLQAVEKKEKIEVQRQALQTILKSKELTIQSFENQYLTSLTIREQLEALTVSDTEENLNWNIQVMKGKMEKAKAQLPLLESQYDKMEEAFLSLQESYRITRKEQEELWRLERKLTQVEETMREKRRQYLEKAKDCRKQLDKEIAWCASFQATFKPMTHHETHDALRDTLLIVQEEVESLDISVLEKEKKDIQENLAVLTRATDLLNRKMQELEKQAILQAKVIGTTLVKSYLKETLQERSFDTVILDEASIASIPALWCAGYLAEKNIVIVGDFKQLSPIVIAETPMALKWLGKDIFEHSGMQDRIRFGKTPPGNFLILVEQFRMEKDIADIANMYYEEYDVKLISDDNCEIRRKERYAFQQWYTKTDEAHAVQLIDTSNLHAWVTGISQGKNKSSRLNFFSASLCVDFAFHVLEKQLEDYKISYNQKRIKLQEDHEDSVDEEDIISPHVLIVAPYKPHIKRINQLIEFGYKMRNLPKDTPFIRAGTIHSLQGSEADIVIFDLVIDEPHWKANLLMPDGIVGDMLKRMFNVAITRAKFKLFVVGNIPYCKKRAKSNALGELLKYMTDKKQFLVRDATLLFPHLTYTQSDTYIGDEVLENKRIICTGSSFYDYLVSDINRCERSLVIYSPFMTQERLSQLMRYLADAIGRGCRITVVTKTISERGKSQRYSYQKCESELRSLGIKVLHKKEMHEKFIFVDNSTVWEGSLNPLSFNGMTGEIMTRYADEKTFSEYAGILEIDRILEVAQNPQEQKCPICGNEVILAESDSGGFYWTCVNKDYTRQPAQSYPHDGALSCGKCGGQYVFSMKNQPRWACALNSSHYQPMKASDLKLDKMLKLIPQKERKAVLKYFEERRLARKIEKPAKKPVIQMSEKAKSKPSKSKQLSLYDLM